MYDSKFQASSRTSSNTPTSQSQSRTMQAVKSMIMGGDAAPKPGEQIDTKNMSREDMVKMIENLQQAQKAQGKANDLKSKAMAIINSKQREDMLKQAFDKEMEAHGHSKAAKRLQSGTWQGLGFGGGIGAATGMGIGTVVGTLVGTIATVPTTGLGLLAGSGVGAIHGPWVKLGGKEEKFEDADPEKVVDALDDEMKQNAQNDQQKPEMTEDTEQKPKRKPKKLEIRSQPNAEPEQQPRKRPKKLEIRSHPKSETEHPTGAPR